MKKKILVILGLIFIVSLSACSTSAPGNNSKDDSTVKTESNETYFVWDEFGAGEDYICGLTEEGAQQTELVIPARCVGFSGSFLSEDNQVERVTFESDQDVDLGEGFSNSNVLKEAILPEGLTTIPDQAFYSADALESVQIPETVTNIGQYAFANCTGLHTVTFSGNQVAEIGISAFMGCSSLSDCELPEGLTTIGMNAFRETKLETVELPASLKNIGEQAFAVMTNLADVTVPEDLELESLGGYLFLGDEHATIHVVANSWAATEAVSTWESEGVKVAVE